jgi:hypothetical protein
MRRTIESQACRATQQMRMCHKLFMDYNDIAADHVEPKGMGSARRDDHPTNIQAAQRKCNLGKRIEKSATAALAESGQRFVRIPELI